MTTLIEALNSQFRQNANPEIAAGQKAYMRNQFEFFGLKTTLRREIQKPFLNKENLPEKIDLESIVKTLWQKPEREFQFFAQELAFKYVKNTEKKDIDLYVFMVTHKSWWDTVDFIAASLMGAYFKNFPDQTERYINNWLHSGNLWLQRSALLFQLKYRHDLDTELLTRIITALTGSKEFFINKAIGWILRAYSKTNPEWVREFVKNTELSPLSKKEALRLIN